MSTQREEEVIDAEMEATVARYLQEHPDFFSRHPAALVGLRVTHESGAAVSIIERQVALLRSERAEQEERLQQMVREAQRNERLSEQFNRLVLELLDAGSLDGVIEAVQRRMLKDFDADAVVLRLFRSGASADASRAEFVDWSESVMEAFEKVIASRQPVCGRLRPGQLESLFADQADTIRSAALIPLAEQGAKSPIYGLLAIGSHSAERFNRDMGTLFLEQIGRVLTRVLRPHLAG